MKKLIALSLFIFYSGSTFAKSKIGIQAVFSSPETISFILLISLLTCYFLFFRFNRFTVNHGPEILTTLGILGCFMGIAKALLYFNSADLSNSIPTLLDGIKTAFCSSLFGVAGALLIKFRHLFRKDPIPQSSGTPKAANIDDLVSAIDGLRKSLVGNEEGTLLTQMKLLRQDSNDQLQKLRESFEKFATHMVENNQKAIIEALENVIKDFNKNLTDQFGENFKQLNQGVEKLVTWQQQYKDELEAIKQAQLETASNMKTASEAFKTVVNKAEDFSTIAGNLKIILEAMSRQKDVLFEQEKALSELLLQMKDVTPEFANKFSLMLTELSSGVKQIQSETAIIVKNFGAQAQSANAEMKNLLADTLKKSQEQLFSVTQENSKMINELSSGVKQLQSETAIIVKNFGAQAQSANAEMKNLLAEVLRKSQQQLAEGLQENSKIIKEGVLALDKALQKELNDSLTSLGKQLASLSEKFVEDYRPLTDRLREVVRLAANV